LGGKEVGGLLVIILVLKEKNINRNSTTYTICGPKSVLHEEKRQEQENHNVGQGPTKDEERIKYIIGVNIYGD
jgi:hypothetical protein